KMRKIIIYIFILLYSCSTVDHEKEIDKLVNKKLTDAFTKSDSDLWNRIENKTFRQIENLGAFDKTDTLKTFHNLDSLILSMGYPDGFFIDTVLTDTKKLISDLEMTEFIIGDECAYKFLHDLCVPIVADYERVNQMTLDSLDLIKFLTLYNPDSVTVSFQFNIWSFEQDPSYLAKYLKLPGQKKVIILMYFSKMIDSTL
ncbi:hypothetical protein ACE01N_20640, partial [Saccharicrinis sp. FJH2]|uniref:hypothetical protein n=1 Tax=Saccharicrinis sp. FJH65 TaxID=3344659 RepID=UPI0035F4E19C